MRLFHNSTHFNFFLVQVRMCLVVIGGEISKMEMAFLLRSRDSAFLQNNVYPHRQTTKLSVFGPQKEYSKRCSRLCIFYSR